MTFEFDNHIYIFVEANKESNGIYSVTCENTRYRGIATQLKNSINEADIFVQGYCNHSTSNLRSYAVESKYFDEIEPDDEMLEWIEYVNKEVYGMRGIKEAVIQALTETNTEELEIESLM